MLAQLLSRCCRKPISLQCYRLASTYVLKGEEKRFSSFLNFVKSVLHNPATREDMKVTSHIPKSLLEELGGGTRQAFHKLNSIVDIIEDFQEKESDLSDLKALAAEFDDDKAFLKQIRNDRDELEKQVEDLRKDIVDSLIEDQELETCEGALLEVLPGVGGAEAMLFARDLYEMYYKFCERIGLDFQQINYKEHEAGGLASASAVILEADGNVFRYLRHEAGTHRVQRFPATDTKGRLHTSTATVSVLQKRKQVLQKVDKSDLQISYTTASGKGGQAVNRSNSCVNLKHLPTGLLVTCEATRNQVENLNRAMIQLTEVLNQRAISEKSSKESSVRSVQIRSRERSDKLRTYNFPHDRVTDHRIGRTSYGVQAFLSGGKDFESMMEALDVHYIHNSKRTILKGLLDEHDKLIVEH